METLELIKVPGKGSYKRTCIEPGQFRKLYENGLTKKKLKSLYGLGHRVWSESIRAAGYSELEVELLRRKKLIRAPRVKKIKTRVSNLAINFQGFEEAYASYIDEPEKLSELVDQTNDRLYELKNDLRAIKKHISQRLKRLGKPRLSFVQNSWEMKVKNILKTLGLDFIVAFPLENRVFDFCIPDKKVLIEVDSDQYHTKDLNYPKNRLAKKHGYSIIRIKEKDIKYDSIIKNKINKKLGLTERL